MVILRCAFVIFLLVANRAESLKIPISLDKDETGIPVGLQVQELKNQREQLLGGKKTPKRLDPASNIVTGRQSGDVTKTFQKSRASAPKLDSTVQKMVEFQGEIPFKIPTIFPELKWYLSVILEQLAGPIWKRLTDSDSLKEYRVDRAKGLLASANKDVMDAIIKKEKAKAQSYSKMLLKIHERAQVSEHDLQSAIQLAKKGTKLDKTYDDKIAKAKIQLELVLKEISSTISKEVIEKLSKAHEITRNEMIRSSKLTTDTIRADLSQNIPSLSTHSFNMLQYRAMSTKV